MEAMDVPAPGGDASTWVMNRLLVEALDTEGDRLSKADVDGAPVGVDE
jgi:hypothetical protein